MTQPTAPVDIAVAFTEAWGRGDMAAAAQYVANDVTFDGTLRAAERLEIRDGKITTDMLVFDSHEVRKDTARP